MPLSPLNQVLISGERDKLPADYQALFDEQQALPADVQFFEERKTAGDLLWTLLLGIGLLVIGLLGTCFGVFAFVEPFTSPATTTVATSVSITPLVVGLLFLLGGGLLLGSLRQRQRTRQAQQVGKATRLGIYLTLDLLISHNEFDYTLIPRSEFRGLQGNTVHYTWNNQAKSFSLPKTLVNATPQTLLDAISLDAISQWATAVPVISATKE